MHQFKFKKYFEYFKNKISFAILARISHFDTHTYACTFHMRGVLGGMPSCTVCQEGCFWFKQRLTSAKVSCFFLRLKVECHSKSYVKNRVCSRKLETFFNREEVTTIRRQDTPQRRRYACNYITETES